MQAAKVLDVSRSFVPVDPNAYPENLHATGDEDNPETRVPVVPYMGYNFLPTGHGYKSFFGANAALDIDSLAPNKPDYIFVFQNLAYQNIIVALCDTGIWLKAAGSSGAWTQAIVLAAPADATFYEWYYLTIKNKLYCYRANGAAFYEINTDITQPLGVIVNTKVPGFITPIAQLGMFRLGSRIGFWDAENAVAWSNPDDFTDFTPSILTGANVTTFNSVLGKISAIRTSDNNAIVYASKSIVGLGIQAGETFLVKAVPILQQSGVPYARQSVESSPNSTHFAYTTTGIYKIENGKADVIVPEVYDYFKTYTAAPIYLKMLQGRFLCFETLDPDAINGVPIMSTGVIAETSLTFPGSKSIDYIYDNPSVSDTCSVIGLVDNGLSDEQTAAATADLGGPALPGEFREPIYTCYLSNAGVKDPDAITWSQAPCGINGPNGTPFTMSPGVGGTNKPGGLTTDATNKTASYGPDAWVDGKWTMERFVAYQTALWKMEQKVLDALIAKILGRSFNETKNTPNAVACAASGPTVSHCDLGLFNTKFSGPKFGFSQCAFWLTRYLLETKQIDNRSTQQVACNPTVLPIGLSGYKLVQNGNLLATVYGSPGAAAAAWNYVAGVYHAGDAPNATPLTATGITGGYISANAVAVVLDNTNTAPATPGGGNYVVAWWAYPGPPAGATAGVTAFGSIVGGVVTLPTLAESSTTKVETAVALNVVSATNAGVLGVESAWCELTHWKVTSPLGVVSYVPASTCSSYDDKNPGSTPGGTAKQAGNDINSDPPITEDGTMCGIPYLSPDLFSPVDWPDQTITYPASSFLLQDGGIAPKYPTIYGFFCYDLHLKKWGKAKLEYKQLLDYSPINSESSSPIDFANFGILAGVAKEDGFIYIFDDVPTESEITWGKIGYYRSGVTDLEEVRFDFVRPATGAWRIDVSMDGQEVVTPLAMTEAFSSIRQLVVYPPYSAKWFNISVSGHYDISYGEVKMLKKGRR